MAVIEALMMLYAKEITSNERITNAIRRISGNSDQPVMTSSGNIEQTILSWVSHTCAALKKRIERDIQMNPEDENVCKQYLKFIKKGKIYFNHVLFCFI